MPVLSYVHYLFNIDQCQAYIHTLRWKDRSFQCPWCQSQDIDPWGTYHYRPGCKRYWCNGCKRTLVVFQKWRSIAIDVTLVLVLTASQSKEQPMTGIAVRCPHCQSDQIVKRGKTARGTPRSLCQNALCAKGSFLLDSCNRGCLPEVKHMIIDMRLHASGVRDTARSLPICPNTVLRELRKKETALASVNTALLRTLNPEEVAWDLERAGEAEMEEMWSFVGHKGNPRWLWHAIDHGTGAVLA